jgi:hypothetical protein
LISHFAIGQSLRIDEPKKDTIAVQLMYTVSDKTDLKVMNGFVVGQYYGYYFHESFFLDNKKKRLADSLNVWMRKKIKKPTF